MIFFGGQYGKLESEVRIRTSLVVVELDKTMG